MTENLLSETEILEGCCNGKRSMQEALFNRFSSRMMGVCRRFSASKMDAEDQLHEGFMIVFKQINTFKGGSLEGWVRKIMVNQCLTSFRKQKRNRLWIQDVTENMESEIGSGQEAWFDFLEANRLIQMIDQLPIGAKTVFNLSAIEGFNHAEIGSMLGINESASRSQLSRAKNTLQMAYLQNNKTGKE